MTEETATATAAIRQRRKRKWDQPAEAVVSAAVATPSLLPFSAAGHLAGLGALPGVFPYMNYLQGMPTAAVQTAATQIIPSATVQQNAAAIVQKFNQDLASKGLLLQAKIQDELIAREITINDAEPGIRYKLTKRQTQEEIQLKTGAVVITRGRYKPPNGPVEHEKPLYLHISAGVNLKDTADRIKAVDHAAAMVEEMLKQGQQVQLPLRSPLPGNTSDGNVRVPMPVAVNLFVGFEADPSFNLIGRIRGPNDQYINHIMTETGASVVLRGKGSGIKEGSSGEESHQPLHLLISSDNLKSVEDAKILAENLLETIRADSFPYRLPPYQLLPSTVPTVSPTSTSYPLPQQAPYQANLSQSQYGGQYSSVGGAYPPPYAPNHPPSFPTTVVTTPSNQAVNPYTNMFSSTKVYAAVPPPSQLLGDGPIGSSGNATEGSVEKKAHVRIRERFSQSSTSDSTTSTIYSATFSLPNSVSSQTEASFMHVSQPVTTMPYSGPPFLPHHLNAAPPAQISASHVSQPSQMVMPGQSFLPSYSQAFAPNHVQPPGTPLYGGYSGVYPDASPLQQVAQALQRPPLPVSVKPLPNSAFLATLTKAQSSSFQDKYSEKQPVQRRKFQEYPVGGKESAGEEKQGQRGLNSSGLDAFTPSRDPSPPSKNMPPTAPRSMPPPKSVSSAAPASTVSPLSMLPKLPSAGFKQPEDHAASHGTGLKLVEYGEEEEESCAGDMPARQVKPFSNGKPFWAA